MSKKPKPKSAASTKAKNTVGRLKKNTTSKSKRKWRPRKIKIRGREIKEPLAGRLRKIRSKYVKDGKFVKYREIYDKYKEVESTLCARGTPDSIDPYTHLYEDELSKSVVASKYVRGDIIDALHGFHNVATEKKQKLKIWIREISHYKRIKSKPKFYWYRSGVKKAMDEINFIFDAFDNLIGKNESPPNFYIWMCYNADTDTAYIDFETGIELEGADFSVEDLKEEVKQLKRNYE